MNSIGINSVALNVANRFATIFDQLNRVDDPHFSESQTDQDDIVRIIIQQQNYTDARWAFRSSTTYTSLRLVSKSGLP